MTVQHVNRKGDTYYLITGRTRTGKPRYYFSRKQSDASVDRVPDGYEIYEKPGSAQVYLRKVKPTKITPLEHEMVADGIRRHAGLEHFVVDIEGDSLVIYLPGMSETDATGIASLLSSPLLAASAKLQAAKAEMIQRSAYSEMMRFELVDADERLYTAQRWCFLGSIDAWHYLAGPTPLATLIEQYVPHLGKETFYELI
ncbi:MAG: hypothetical protein ACC628_12980 [Pirellulaceae bacterium]